MFRSNRDEPLLCINGFHVYFKGFEVNFMDDVGQTLLNWASAFGTQEMVSVVMRMPYDVCWMPYAVCWMPYGVCCMLYAVCWMPYVGCCVVYVGCCMLYGVCCMLDAVCSCHLMVVVV